MRSLPRFDSVHGFTLASSSRVMPGHGQTIGCASRLLAKVDRPDVVQCRDRNRASLSGPALPTLRTIPAPAAEVVHALRAKAQTAPKPGRKAA